jgi:hypothetical protein
MNEKETMMAFIRWEYEQNELTEYDPQDFATYLLEKLAEERLKNE